MNRLCVVGMGTVITLIFRECQSPRLIQTQIVLPWKEDEFDIMMNTKDDTGWVGGNYNIFLHVSCSPRVCKNVDTEAPMQ